MMLLPQDSLLEILREKGLLPFFVEWKIVMEIAMVTLLTLSRYMMTALSSSHKWITMVRGAME